MVNWGSISAGAAAVAVVGGFLGWIVRMTIKSTIGEMTKDFATRNYVRDRIDVHEQVHHQKRDG